MNSENKCEADPGQTSDIDSTQESFYSPELFQRGPKNVHSFIHSTPRIFILLRCSYSCLIGCVRRWHFHNHGHVRTIVWSWNSMSYCVIKQVTKLRK